MIVTDKCTACRACEGVCSKNAITLIEDKESFLAACIDHNACVDCGLCRKVCPELNTIDVNRLECPPAWAAVFQDRSVLMNSSSGGFFTALANNVIDEGGVVFGVELNDVNHAVHTCIESKADLNKIRSSKYIASDTNSTYQQAKHLLNDGRKVLYSGLPCQIAGLRAFLRKDYDNLLLVDVICHGTPSIKLFDVYLEGMRQKLGYSLQNYKFRDKSKYGWGCYWSFTYGNKRKNGGQHDDPYVTAFIDGYAKRETCYECKYTGIDKRPGDITLGDYWGIDIVHPEMASNDGVSAVIANTSKGTFACEKALSQCRYVNSDAVAIGRYNPSLIRAEARPERRNNLYNGIYAKSPLQFLQENLRVSAIGVAKTKLRLMLPYKLRILIKKLK